METLSIATAAPLQALVTLLAKNVWNEANAEFSKHKVQSIWPAAKERLILK